MAVETRIAQAVSTSGLTLYLGKTVILDGIDLSLAAGRTLALLGPSGCGKTTLLRLVAGLLMPTSGAVSIGGSLVADAATGVSVPPERRNLGMVFQDYALWPHLSVGRNVSFPLEMRRVGRAEREARTRRALEQVGLASLADRRPSELSGGQQQRVAIARAIVAEPRLILFDEPLSNLDRELRENMVGELAELISALHLTAIYVTHDQAEALTLADEVAVMRAGRIVQLDTPDRLIDAPATADVANFLRLGGIVHLERRDASWFFADSLTAMPTRGTRSGDRARVLIPTAAVTIGPASGDSIAAAVLKTQFRGDSHHAVVAPAGLKGVELQALSHRRLRLGETVHLRIDPDRLHWFGQDVTQD